MKTIEDLNGLSVEELQQRLSDVQDEATNLRMQKATHQLNNPVRIRYIRRDIARLKTLIRQHELGIHPTKNQDN